MKTAGMPADLVDGYWPATDLRDSDPDTLARHAELSSFRSRYDRDPLPGEVGCALSQREALAQMIETGAPLMALFEDDAHPVRLEVFEAVRGILERLRGPAEAGRAFLCHLGLNRWHKPRHINRILKGFDSPLHRRWCLRDAGPAPKIWRAHACLLSREAALRIVKAQKPITMFADDFELFGRRGLVDTTLYVQPGLFWQADGEVSTIRGAMGPVEMNTAAAMDRLSTSDWIRRIVARRFDL